MAHHQAAISFRLAMPNLSTWDGIHAYIACVAQGVVMKVFSGRDGTQLLYAAQVAISVMQHKAEEMKKEAKQ